MATSHSAWYQSLSDEKRAAIRKLHEVNPYWNFVGPLFIALWIAVATVMYQFPYTPVWIVGYVLIGILIHGMANLMHEGIHGTLFKKRKWDHWYGFVMAAPALFSITAYGVNHLLHHKHNRTEKDPDEFTNVTTNRWVMSLFYYVWLIIGMFIYVVRVPCVALWYGTRKERILVIAEHTAVLLAIGLTAYLLWSRQELELLLHFWIIPLGVAAFLGNVRGWAEHTRTDTGHPLRETRTVTSNRLFSFLNINLNYHLEHHLFPGVPWYNLPKVHRILLDDYRAAGSSIYRSYTRFLFDALRTGYYGRPEAPSLEP